MAFTATIVRKFVMPNGGSGKCIPNFSLRSRNTLCKSTATIGHATRGWPVEAETCSSEAIGHATRGWPVEAETCSSEAIHRGAICVYSAVPSICAAKYRERSQSLAA
jgi:hypothetical protein